MPQRLLLSLPLLQELADVGHFQEVARKTGSELCRVALLDSLRSDEENLKKLTTYFKASKADNFTLQGLKAVNLQSFLKVC